LPARAAARPVAPGLVAQLVGCGCDTARMSTLATLLEALAAARRAGEDFDSAWEAATALALGASCDPADWRGVLETTRDGWRAAYHRMPAKRCERALSLLGEDAEPTDVGRDCRRCGRPIPPERGRRRAALYCSSQCRRAWSRERSPLAA
jgi:hypothetical protein